MKQNLHYFFSILLTIILLSPPAAVWAARNTDYFRLVNHDNVARNCSIRHTGSNTYTGWTKLEYKNGSGAWTNVTTNTEIWVDRNDTIKFRVQEGKTVTVFNKSTDYYGWFRLQDGNWEALGDLLTLISIEEPKDRRVKLTGTNEKTFMYLFKESPALTSARKLKFPDKLNARCCDLMFNGCTGLVTGPEDMSNIDSIPQYGLNKLFYNCSNLTNIPKFPTADSIGNYGCQYMFYGCKKLENPVVNRVLPATILGNYAYCNMFSGCTTLVAPPVDIRATTIYQRACSYMYSGCTGLKSIGTINPYIPASTYGCEYMFSGCTGLDTLEDINFTSIGDYGCQYMFSGCTGLTTIGKISATSIGNRGFQYMFSGCTGLTTIKDIDITTSIGNYGCYYMFSGCKNLGDCSNATLTAKRIGDYAYSYMFDQCSGTSPTTGLTKAPQIAADDIGSYSCYYMFNKCSLLTTPPDTLRAKTLCQQSYDHMFFACVKLTKSPVIMATSFPTATTSSTGAFNSMFWNTAALKEIHTRFTDWKKNGTYYYSTYNWVSGTSGSGTFFCSSSLPEPTTNGAHTIQSGWTVKYYPIITFRVAKDYRGNPTGGNWGEGESDTISISGDWYGDGPFPTAKHPTKNFRGWVDEEGTEVTQEKNKVARANPVNVITLYAKFVSDEYDLTWNFNGGTTTTPDANYTHGSVIVGTSITPPTPFRSGYVFNGWNTTPASTMPAENITYTAQWTAINYTFDVATNEGAWSDESTADSVRTVSGIAALKRPTKDGFTFERWNTSADGTGTDMDINALPPTSTTYYAIFSNTNYFRFIAERATTISTSSVGTSPTKPSLMYSNNGGATWITFTVGTTSVALAAGESVLFKGTNPAGFNPGCTTNSGDPSGKFWYFTSTDSVSVAGNIMTLVQGSSPTNEIPADNCFAAIMKGMKLVSAAKLVLPTTTRSGCYMYMFSSSSIRIAPELPALNVAAYAYMGMFSKCNKLRIAPEIPATTVGANSMNRMFNLCTSLNKAPSELKALRLETASYSYMFYACSTATGLQKTPIIRAINMDAPSTSDGAAMGMMFAQCNQLNNMSVRIKEWKKGSTYFATNNWMSNITTTLGTFTCPSRLNATTRDVSHIKSNWTIYFIPELTFDVETNGGTWADDSEENRVIEPETPLTSLPNDVIGPNDRTFIGWNTEIDGSGTWLTLENRPVISTTPVVQTYYAIYASVNMTFKVKTNEGDWGTSTGENDSIIARSDLLEIPVAERENYSFVGWNTNSAATTNELNLEHLPNEPTTYYAIFEPFYTFDVATNGTTWDGEDDDDRSWTKTELMAEPTPLTTPAGIDGYYFEGWKDGTGAAYPGASSLDGTTPNTFYATYSPIYTFAPNGGTWEDKSTTSKEFHGSFELPEIARNGYTFNGWSPAFNPASLPSTPTTYTAQWTPNFTFDVNTNGGDWGTDTGTNDSIIARANLLEAPVAEKENYSFVGWNTNSAATTNGLDLENLPSVPTTYYAIFEAANFDLLDDQNDAYYTALKDMDGIGLQQITFKGTFPAKRWITFNVPFDFFIPEDHPFANHVYEFLGADGNATEGFDIHFQGGVFKLEAGMPYLYYGDETLTDFVFAADGENNTILTIDADALEAESVWETDPTINTSGAEYRSTVKMTSLPGGDKHYIFLSGNRLYYPHALGNTLYAFSGYFYVPSTGSIAPRVRMMVNGKETDMKIETFGEEEQAAEAGTKKYILDGTLVIERNGIRYDAHGHKLN